MPWFMTLFGRDTLITSLQTMLFGPELANAALRALAALQATEEDATIDAEPGKILHELRRGKAAESWFPIYYGTVDATPLFLVLLSEVWRWTGDHALIRELEPAARAALAWTERYGDLDGDGFVEYARRAPNGLANQSWKDSGDSQQFREGRLADGPIAPAEVRATSTTRGDAWPSSRARSGRTPLSAPSSSSGPTTFATASTGPSGSRTRRLRTRARRRETPRRLAVLEQRPPPLVWDRPRRPGRRSDCRARVGRPLVRVGHPHHGLG